MIAPGIRVVRGPDWIWQIQGKDVLISFSQQHLTFQFSCKYLHYVVKI